MNGEVLLNLQEKQGKGKLCGVEAWESGICGFGRIFFERSMWLRRLIGGKVEFLQFLVLELSF